MLFLYTFHIVIKALKKDGKGYYKFSMLRRSWLQARHICKSQEGEHLLTIDSEEEADEIMEMCCGRDTYIHINYNKPKWIYDSTQGKYSVYLWILRYCFEIIYLDPTKLSKSSTKTFKIRLCFICNLQVRHQCACKCLCASLVPNIILPQDRCVFNIGITNRVYWFSFCKKRVLVI